MLAGCGGGSSLSGPNSNTGKGLGTLVVRVTGGGVGAANGGSFVTLEKFIKVVRDGRATFTDLKPGRYYVRADLQGINLSGDSAYVNIEADKTRTVTLNLTEPLIPRPTPYQPFPN